MLRIVRGADCYWVIGKSRTARVSLSGDAKDWLVLDRQTKLVQAADAPVVTDNHLLPVALEIPAGSDFDVAAILALCDILARKHGADGLALTLHCDQSDDHLDECLRLLEGVGRLGPARTAIVTAASSLTPATAIALERAGVEYAQVTHDGAVHADRAFERDVTNLRYAASCGSLLWHVRIRLTKETAGTADTLLNVLSERLAPSSLDVSFAFVDEPAADGGCLPQDLAEAISRFYVRALAAGFNVRLPSCHRCATCDSRGSRMIVVVNADGILAPDRQTLCGCARLDHVSPDHNQLTDAVRSAILASLYEVCGLE